MAAPAAAVAPLADRVSSAMVPAPDFEEFDAGSDTYFLPRVAKAFETSADATVVVVTLEGNTRTKHTKAGAVVNAQIVQIRSTGTSLGGGYVTVYY